MKRIANIIETVSLMISGYFTGWLVFIFMFLVLAEVVSRYILRSPLILADEIGGYLVVAVTFIGLAYTGKAKGHIRIEVLVSRLPVKIRNWLRLFTLVMAVAFMPILTKAAYELITYSATRGTRGQLSGTWLAVPQQWPQTVMLIGVILLTFQLVVEIGRAIHTIRTHGGDQLRTYLGDQQ